MTACVCTCVQVCVCMVGSTCVYYFKKDNEYVNVSAINLHQIFEGSKTIKEDTGHSI